MQCFNKGNFLSSLYKFILNDMARLLIFNLLNKVSINSSNSFNWCKILPCLYTILNIFLFSFCRCFSYCFTQSNASRRVNPSSALSISSRSSNLSLTIDYNISFLISSRLFFAFFLLTRSWAYKISKKIMYFIINHREA